MYAIIEDGSHQFRVREGDRIRVDRRDGKPGDELVFSNVLLITDKMATRRSEPPPWTVPVSWARSQSVSGQEDHHPEVSPSQKRAQAERSSSALHHGSDHECASTLAACLYSFLKIIQSA